MKKGIINLAAILTLTGFSTAGGVLFAAEFEVLDRFSVDGYSVLRGSADIPGGSFTVGASAFVVKDGKIGIGMAGPGAALDIRTGAGSTYAVKVSSSDGTGSLLVVQQDGNVGIGTTAPAASLDIAGEVKIGSTTLACSITRAGVLRWTNGHISVCNGTDWRQLDNQPPPTVSAINPVSGLTSGGTLITINGSGFNLGLELLIGGVAATVTGISGSQITATTPAGSSGSKEVKITNTDGQYCTSAYTYNAYPVITTISPASGQTLRTTNITIAGSGFQTGATLAIGGVTTAINTLSAIQITATAPAFASSGAQNVTVTNPDTGAVTQTGGFTYIPFATGGTVTGDGTYTIHTFASGGTFTANYAGNVEVLVVAGGGGGGRYGGGGGAGGLLTNSSYAVTAGQAVTVTVGAGGLGRAGDAQAGERGTSGSNSVFGTITAIGGGAGGSYGNNSCSTGLTGGSGGGGGNNNLSGCGGGAAGPGGYAGSAGSGNVYRGGGGGGAGEAGGTHGTSTGGNGFSSSISGSAVTYAGGGSGCYDSQLAGGTGGGGAGYPGGAVSASVVDGIANSGGGGGGTRDATVSGTWRAGNGGSGIVIVRYPK